MNNIKKYRLQAGMKQIELCNILGISQGALSGWENGRYEPDIKSLNKMAEHFNITVDELLGNGRTGTTEVDSGTMEQAKPRRVGIKIPVLGYVPAGMPIEAIEDILDYEEITPEMARNGEHFALKIKGDSMIPNIMDGDIVIVRVQPDVESGETAIVKVNGDEATCKRVVKHKAGISIVANNPLYEPIFFTNKEIEELPVTVVGKVVELRRSF